MMRVVKFKIKDFSVNKNIKGKSKINVTNKTGQESTRLEKGKVFKSKTSTGQDRTGQYRTEKDKVREPIQLEKESIEG